MTDRSVQIYYGEEQGLYLLDSTAANYLFG